MYARACFALISRGRFCGIPSFLSSFTRTRNLSTSYPLLHNSVGNQDGQGLGLQEFQPILVSIEGNIGAGKTTLLKQLQERHPEWISIDEPVDTWSNLKNEHGESILEIFYKDRRRWSYTFQNCALLTRFQNIENAVNKVRLHYNQTISAEFVSNKSAATLDKFVSESNKIFIPPKSGKVIFLTERCLDTDYHVFTRMLQEDGSIDALEIELYERLLKQLKASATKLSAIVHVNTEPDICVQRIKQRGRTGEEGISMDYLNMLDRYQTAWVNSTSIPTLVTDVSNFTMVEKFIEDLGK